MLNCRIKLKNKTPLPLKVHIYHMSVLCQKLDLLMATLRLHVIYINFLQICLVLLINTDTYMLSPNSNKVYLWIKRNKPQTLTLFEGATGPPCIHDTEHCISIGQGLYSSNLPCI